VNLLVLGLSHKTAPVAQREKATMADPAARQVLRDLLAAPGVAEAVALSTCNRTEVYVATPSPVEAEDALARAMLARTRISANELACAQYVLRDERAAAQLFRVASSLDSMVIGESEIQGQVRAAWERAGEEGTAGPMLNRLFRQALEVGKKVRTSTRIGHGAASVSTVAVDLAEQVLDDLPGGRVLVIGAGQMAESTTQALVSHGVRDVVVANRTVGTARELAGRFGGRGIGFDRLDRELRDADIIISSTDAPHPILCTEQFNPVMTARAGRPMVVIDISVPRDIDPAVAEIDGVALFDIDDLERVVEMNLNGRRLEAERGEDLVMDAVESFTAWTRGMAAAPAIMTMRAQAEQLRRAELARLDGQWEGLSDADRARLDHLTRSLINKLLHAPTVWMREAAESGDEDALRSIATMNDLLGLSEARIDS
jgi:glutamyl-tRNA reductase